MKVKWTLRSGATQQVTNCVTHWTHIRETEGSVLMVNVTTLQIKKVGTFHITITIDGINSTVELGDFVYGPNQTTNFLSNTRVQQKNVEVHFKMDQN